jgi:excisionase family DNA binding protein
VAKIPDSRLLDVPGAAQYLDTTVRNIRELVYKRRIPYVKLGRLVRFDRRDLDRWIEEQKEPALTRGTRPRRVS